jgi:glutamate-1-semialdehyde aminotransferase
MSIMGIGTNTLGYSHDEVDNAVIDTVTKGNMSTLNCPEEVYLAEKLIEMNPWADMVRFARSGGEANAIAIRIARAASGRDEVAICGYHGWHDWYLSANHNDGDGLSNHLLPGLDPMGVPKNLKNTVHPFLYNNFEELLNIVNNHKIGVIKMEVVRNFGPENDFLQKVRNLATQKSIVLIFDECTSGFRETYGGIFKKYNVEPDMTMFGKTIGNGYALTAVVGKREIMEAAQKTFISSTFWTERIGAVETFVPCCPAITMVSVDRPLASVAFTHGVSSSPPSKSIRGGASLSRAGRLSHSWYNSWSHG